MSQQVDIFDAICGALLLHLYESFPVRLDVEFTDLPLNEELEHLSSAEIEQWMDVDLTPKLVPLARCAYSGEREQ